jgi:hypothetical protein
MTEPSPLRRRLARLALVGLACAGVTFVGLNAWRAMPPRVRATLVQQVAGPVAEWRHGEPHRPETGPAFGPAQRQATDETALRAALALAFPGRSIDRVRLVNGPIVRSNAEFAWQDPNDPALDRLIERLGLGAFRAADTDEDALLRALTTHIRTRAPHVEDDAGTTVSGVAPSADAILDRVAAGGTLTCYYYSLLMVQALAALGRPARVVANGIDVRDWHASVEVFHHGQRKWVLSDPDFDLMYARDGAFQNAWDLHDLFMTGYATYRRELHAQGREDSAPMRVQWFAAHPEALGGLQLLRGSVRAPRIDLRLGESEGGVLLGAYWTFSVAMRNDYLSVDYPKGHPRATRELAFADLGAGWLRTYDGELTNRPGDLYFTVDAAQMAFEAMPGENSVRVHLDTYTPGFRAFRVQIGDAAPVETQADAVTWSLGPEGGRIRIWPVNSRGVQGAVSEAAVVFTPPQPAGPRPAATATVP